MWWVPLPIFGRLHPRCALSGALETIATSDLFVFRPGFHKANFDHENDQF